MTCRIKASKLGPQKGITRQRGKLRYSRFLDRGWILFATMLKEVLLHFHFEMRNTAFSEIKQPLGNCKYNLEGLPYPAYLGHGMNTHSLLAALSLMKASYMSTRAVASFMIAT